MSEHDSNALLAEILRRIDAGEQVDIESICASHPDIADELRSYVDGDALLADMAADDLEGDTSQPGVHDETVRPRGQAGPAIDMSGQTFGRYEIKRQLGQGAMGAVYLARDTQLDRDVALKIPKVELAGRDEFLKRFKREAQSAANLNHPGICPVFDFGEQDGLPFITMAYIEGEPLSRFVGRKQVDNQWVADTVRKIADALAHAHEQGVVHRDLKSGNVLVNRSGEPIVTDFGLAVRVDQDDETRITQVGALVGTPAYMSPEQIEGESSVIGPPSDVYALGVILYELLAGELPFRGSMGSLIAQITRDDPKSPIRHNPDADPGLCDLCLKMMSKRVSQRPESMAAVARLLNDLVIGAGKPKPIDEKTKKKLAKLEAGKARVADLVRRGQFAQAVSILEKMAAVNDKDSTEYAAWAKSEVKRIQAMPKKLRDGAPQLLAAAKKMMARHDYGQAAQMLQQVPADMRSPEAAALLHEAIELQDEADLLLTDLHDCVATRTYDGIEDNVRRLLELKPGNKFARELWAALETYQKIPRAQRNYRFDNSGQLQPREEGLSKGLLAGIGVAVVVFGAMAFAMKRYLADESPDAGKVTVNQVDVRDNGGDPASDSNPLEANLPIAADEQQFPPSERRISLKFPPRESTPAYVEVPSLTYRGQHPLTIEAWVKFDSNVHGYTGGRETLFSLAEMTSFNRGKGLFVAVDPTNTAETVDWPLAASFRHTNLYTVNVHSSTSFPFERWTHVAVVLDSDVCTTFINGTQSGRKELQASFEPSDSSLVLGAIRASKDLGEQAVRHAFTGELDEVRISRVARYSAPFQPAETLALDSETIALFHCDEGSGDVLKDSSGNGHDGKIVGATWVDGLAPDTNQTQNWTNLFNGRDFTGWREYGGGSVGEGWDVNNGELQITGRGNGIVTDATYDNFELEFEWATSDAGGDTGLFYRVSENRNTINYDGLEYQIFDNPESSVWNDPARRSGALFGIAGQALAIKPRGEFNTSRIVADGDHIEHWLNGVKVCEATIGSTAWDAALSDRDRQKFRDYPLAATGHIGIQSFGNPTRFRNIRIRELTRTSVTDVVDLLSTVQSSNMEETWRRNDDGSLIHVGQSARKVTFSEPFPDDYELNVRGTFDADVGQFAVSLPVADRHCAVLFQARKSGAPFGGIEMIDGQPQGQSPVPIKEDLLGDGAFDLTFRVESDPQVTAITVINGTTPVAEWSGDTSRLSLTNQWKPDQPKRAAIGAFGKPNPSTQRLVRVDSATLRSLGSAVSASTPAWTNLLTRPQIADLREDWSLEPDGILKYDAAGNGVQTIFAPTMPAAYEIEVDFTTNDDINQLGLTLPIANGLCQFMLFKNGPSPGGVEFIDGKQFQQVDVQVSSQQLGDVSRNLRVSVDSTPQTTTIIARCDDVEVFRWSGDTDRLSLTNHWDHGRAGKLAIATGTAPASRRAGRRGNCEIKTLRWRPAAASLTAASNSSEPTTPEQPSTPEPLATFDVALDNIDHVDVLISKSGIDLVDKSNEYPLVGKFPTISVNGKSWGASPRTHINFDEIPGVDPKVVNVEQLFVESIYAKQGVIDYAYVNGGVGFTMVNTHLKDYEFRFKATVRPDVLPITQRDVQWNDSGWLTEFRNYKRPPQTVLPVRQEMARNSVDAKKRLDPFEYHWIAYWAEFQVARPSSFQAVTDNHLASATRQLNAQGGDYLFRITANDGVRLLVDGKEVINYWKPTRPKTHEVTVPLSQGTHEISVDHGSLSRDEVCVSLHVERLSS